MKFVEIFTVAIGLEDLYGFAVTTIYCFAVAVAGDDFGLIAVTETVVLTQRCYSKFL